jgi:hypothetical protein
MPKQKPSKLVVELTAKLEELSDTTDIQEDMDERVHSAASGLASDVNNGGFFYQVEFLIQQLGKAEALNVIEEMMRKAKE